MVFHLASEGPWTHAEMDTRREYGKLLFIPRWREVLDETSTRKGFLGLYSHKLAPANLTIFDTPFDLVMGPEANGGTNGLRESHPVLLVDYRCTHGGIIPQREGNFKPFSAKWPAGCLAVLPASLR